MRSLLAATVMLIAIPVQAQHIAFESSLPDTIKLTDTTRESAPVVLTWVAARNLWEGTSATTGITYTFERVDRGTMLPDGPMGEDVLTFPGEVDPDYSLSLTSGNVRYVGLIHTLSSKRGSLPIQLLNDPWRNASGLRPLVSIAP